MGSRAIAVVTKDAGVASRRFGVSDGSTGVVFTRTGRAFFAADSETLVSSVRDSIAPLFDSLDTDWLALDCELLPWSAKALGLIKSQYASVGAAAQAALPAAAKTLNQASGRGLDVEALAARVQQRTENARAYRAAYAAYCRPSSGLDGVTLAPFQILAAEGRALGLTESHRWHLAELARLSTDLITPTRHRFVDLSSADQRAAATDWWLDLTSTGGEGMVVKPLSGGVTRAQPGLKVRGREYLRIIYGPDYLAPEHLSRLKRRAVGAKRGLAAREFGLGLEGLERFARGAPLRAVHECVFAVLALESEPIDPRL